MDWERKWERKVFEFYCRGKGQKTPSELLFVQPDLPDKRRQRNGEETHVLNTWKEQKEGLGRQNIRNGKFGE